MHILFVDDLPNFKVNPQIQYLQQKNLSFTYEVIGSVYSAIRYLNKHSNEVDLAIVDLGLPLTDDGSDYESLNGLLVTEFIMKIKENKNIPIIINSSTQIPNEKQVLKKYTDEGINITHVEMLNVKWLLNYINELK